MSVSEPAAPKLKAPDGTCDTHIHIFDKTYPVIPKAIMNPPDAPVEEYEAVRKRLNIGRTIVVQASIYGTDNSLTMKSVAAMGDSARAVVVIDDKASDAEIEKLSKAGAVGIRFHMLGGVLGWDLLEPMAARVTEHGWLVQLQTDGRTLDGLEDRLKKLPGTLVIDHTGKFLEPVNVDHPSFRTLVRLLETGKVYVKLSAPYETSKVGPPHYDDVGALAKVLARTAPDRILWATNFPHSGPTGKAKVDDAALLDMMLDWVPDEKVRHKMFVTNPATLYGF